MGTGWPVGRGLLGRRPLRVAIGGISHETNTFSPEPTTLDAFRRRSFLAGDALLKQSRGVRNALGGIVDEAAASGLTLAPTLFASATPAGRVTRAAFDHLLDRLLDRLRAARLAPWSLDGVILALHGAMVVEGEDDAEGTILDAVRAAVGPERPVIAVLDFHANVSPAMIAASDLLLSYDTYPHVDTYERGREAVGRWFDLWSGRIHPTTAFRLLPLLTPLPPQRTTGSTPMAEVMRLALDLERGPGVVTINVAGGFPYSDIAGAGISVSAVTDGDAPLADELADRVAAALWDRRHQFQVRGLSPDDAIDRALEIGEGEGPVILADVADNPGAGAPGDGTVLVERLLARGVTCATVATIADPHVVALAFDAGVGATVHLTDDLPCRVQAVTDGVFTNRGPMGTGGTTRLGRTAVLAVDGIDIVVCERRVQALDPALFDAVGIDPTLRRILALKSGVHFRAAFEGLAAAVIEVETPGLSGSDLAAFPYRHVRRPIVPLDPDREVRYLD
jgi:microcystin degradation protein MlrC